MAGSFEITRQDFRKIQSLLKAEGLYKDKIDGAFGGHSEEAVRKFIEKKHLGDSRGVIYKDGKFLVDDQFLLALLPLGDKKDLLTDSEIAARTEPTATVTPAEPATIQTLNYAQTGMSNKLSTLSEKTSLNSAAINANKEDIQSFNEDRKTLDKRVNALAAGLYQTMLNTVIGAILAAVVGAFTVIMLMKKTAEKQIAGQVEDFEKTMKAHEDKTESNLDEAIAISSEAQKKAEKMEAKLSKLKGALDEA